MNEFNRNEQMKKIHESRKAATHEKVSQAINRLISFNKPINFNSVSNESGITKATLYNNPDIKIRIESLRLQRSIVPSSSQVKREMNDVNKDLLIASLKRTIKKLENENRQLIDQLNIKYVEIYRKI